MSLTVPLVSFVPLLHAITITDLYLPPYLLDSDFLYKLLETGKVVAIGSWVNHVLQQLQQPVQLHS